MRDLTKSMLNLPWILTLFGVGQAARLLLDGGERRGAESVTAALDAVARAAEGELVEPWRSACWLVSGVQRSVVDLAFDLARPDLPLATDLGRTASDLLQAGITAVRTASQDEPAPAPAGWGPIPDGESWA
jgi:hypothetical protein